MFMLRKLCGCPFVGAEAWAGPATAREAPVANRHVERSLTCSSETNPAWKTTVYTARACWAHVKGFGPAFLLRPFGVQVPLNARTG